MPRLSRAETMAMTRTKLIDAALSTFMKVGFAAAKIDGIAEDAGYSRGAFYAHFSNKEEILLAAISSEIEGIGKSLIARIDTCTTTEEVIVAVSDWAQHRSQSRDAASLMLEMMQKADRGGTFSARFVEIFETNWHGIGEALRPFFPGKILPGTPGEIVAIIVSLTYGPAANGITGHQSHRLVSLVLRAMMIR